MRTLYLTIALWHDPFWRGNFKKSRRQRRFWLARPPMRAAHGHALALQFGAYTLRITLQGRTP